MDNCGFSEVQRTSRFVDYSHVDYAHREIHDRLENWAHWCFAAVHAACHPMFRSYQPPQHWEQAAPRYEVDLLDAHRIERAVGLLPLRHREAIRWCYVHRGSPGKASKAIGVTRIELQMLVRDGRQILINRNA